MRRICLDSEMLYDHQRGIGVVRAAENAVCRTRGPEMIDRNKTELTHNITNTVHRVLYGYGFKPVETEVPVADRWIADLAGIIIPTTTELINLKLIKRRPSYQYGKIKDEKYSEDYRVKSQLWEMERISIPDKMSVIVEVKVSRSDFKNDTKWNRESPADLRYLAFPTGLIRKDEYPEGWGIMQCSKDGSSLVRVIHSPLLSTTNEQLLEIAFAIAIRRDHRTRYKLLREARKQICIDDGERKTVARLNTAIQFILAMLNGRGTLAEAQFYFGIHTKIPQYIVDGINSLRQKVNLPPEDRK